MSYNKHRQVHTYVTSGVEPAFDVNIYKGIEPLDGQMDSITHETRDEQGRPIHVKLRDSERYGRI